VEKGLKVLIVDDELPARQELYYLLENNFKDKIEIVGEAEHGWDAIEKINQLKPNVVFLDINMPGINGLDVAAFILKTYPHTAIIFITAFDDYAIKAFEIHALDYLVKPVTLTRLEITVDRLSKEGIVINQNKLNELINQVNREIPQQKINKIPCEESGRIFLIKPEDIIYCTVEDGKSLVITKQDKFKTFYTLNELEEKLAFFRTHRSFLVNQEYIKVIEPLFHGCYQLILDDDNETVIPMSRIQSKKLKEMLDI